LVTFSSLIKTSSGISKIEPWTPHCPYCLAMDLDPITGLEAPTMMLRFPTPDKSVETVRSAKQSMLCHDFGNTIVMLEKYPLPEVVSYNCRDVEVRTA